jgi:CHASE2 domain-containing sensor protein
MKVRKNDLIDYLLRPALIAFLVCGIILLFDLNPLDPSAGSSRKMAVSNMLETYYSIAHGSDSYKEITDPNVILIRSDGCSRGKLAALLKTIAKANPKVVALDMIFRKPEKPEEDEALLESMNQLKDKLVVACALRNENPENHRMDSLQGNFFDSIVPDFARGCINLTETRFHSIYSFSPFLHLSKDMIPTFDLQVARKADPASAGYLLNRRTGEKFINFRSVIFDVMDPNEVLSNLKALRNKVILIGDVDNQTDMHVAPIDDKMDGLHIHAYTISTILSERYISAMSGWGHWILTGLLIIAFLNLITYASRKYKKGLRVFIAACIFVSAWSFTFIGYCIFINFDYVINFSPIRLAVAMTPVYGDAFAALESFIMRIIKKK